LVSKIFVLKENLVARIRAGILGAGLISGKKHIPAFHRSKSTTDLVAICDVNLQAAERLAREFGVPKVYSDLSQLLREEKPDLIDICTPPRTHAKLAIEAIRGGCHVLIEKPMAMTVAECDEILTAAGEAGVQVCVAHSDLFYHPFMRARDLVADGTIGEFRGMRIHLSTPTDYMTSREDHWANKLPGGVIGETGPHIVYMTLAFINPIQKVSVQAMHLMDYPWSPFEDYRIELIGEQAMSSVSLCYTSNQWMALVDIFGSSGALFLDLQGLSLVRYNRPVLSAKGVAWSMLGNSLQSFANTIANGLRLATGRIRSTHETIIQKFAESIASGKQPPASGEEGREAIRVMNMIVEELEASKAQQI
jgi:predicted dehydrogenase